MNMDWPPGSKQNPRGTEEVPSLKEQKEKIRGLLTALESELSHLSGPKREIKEQELKIAESKYKALEGIEKSYVAATERLQNPAHVEREMNRERREWARSESRFLDSRQQHDPEAARLGIKANRHELKQLEAAANAGKSVDEARMRELENEIRQWEKEAAQPMGEAGRSYAPSAVKEYFKDHMDQSRNALRGTPADERKSRLNTAVNLRARAVALAQKVESAVTSNEERRYIREMNDIRERFDGLVDDVVGAREQKETSTQREQAQVDLAAARARLEALEAQKGKGTTVDEERALETEVRRLERLVNGEAPETQGMPENISTKDMPKENTAEGTPKKEKQEKKSSRKSEETAADAGGSESPTGVSLDALDARLSSARAKLEEMKKRYGKEAAAAAPAGAAGAGGDEGRITVPGSKKGPEGSYYRTAAENETLLKGMPFGGAKVVAQERPVDEGIVKSKEKFDLSRTVIVPQKEGMATATAAATEVPDPEKDRPVVEGVPDAEQKETIEPVRPLDIESLLKGDLANIGVTAQAEADRYYDELTGRLTWISPLQRDFNRLRGDIGYTAREIAETKSDRKRNKLITQLRREAADMLAIGAVLMDQVGAREAAQTGAEYVPSAKPLEEHVSLEDEKQAKSRRRKGILGGLGVLGAAAALFMMQGGGDSKKEQVKGASYTQVDKEKGAAVGSGGKQEKTPTATNSVEKAQQVEVKLSEADVTHPHGAEEALHRLQQQLTKQYGGVKKGNPESVNVILGAKNPHSLAMAYGFYEKGTGKSAVMYAGDAFKIDSHGTFTFTSVDHPKGKVITLLDAAGKKLNTIDSLHREKRKYEPYQAHINSQRYARPSIRVTYNQPENPMQRVSGTPEAPQTSVAQASQQRAETVSPGGVRIETPAAAVTSAPRGSIGRPLEDRHRTDPSLGGAAPTAESGRTQAAGPIGRPLEDRLNNR